MLLTMLLCNWVKLPAPRILKEALADCHLFCYLFQTRLLLPKLPQTQIPPEGSADILLPSGYSGSNQQTSQVLIYTALSICVHCKVVFNVSQTTGDRFHKRGIVFLR